MREETEEQLVWAICDALELSGFIPRQINQRRADLAGGDTSWDLAVCHEDCGATSLNVEVKTPTGRIRTYRPRSRRGYGYSQKDLLDMGLIVVVRTVEDAVRESQEWRLRTLRGTDKPEKPPAVVGRG